MQAIEAAGKNPDPPSSSIVVQYNHAGGAPWGGNSARETCTRTLYTLVLAVKVRSPVPRIVKMRIQALLFHPLSLNGGTKAGKREEKKVLQ